MTTEAPIFSPEIEELLREIAKEPDSVLLRVPREKVPAALMETRSPIGPMTAGLSNAERELVRVHREEFAFQLRRACLVKHANSERGQQFLTVRGLRISTDALPDHEQIAQGVMTALNRAPGTQSVACGWAWTHQPLEHWPTIPELCAIAHQLAPSELHVLHAGAYWALHDRSGMALSLFGHILPQTRDPLIFRLAHASIAYCYDTLGQLARSVGHWSSACLDAPAPPDYVPSWLAVSLRAGADRDILDANGALGDMGSDIHQHVIRFVDRVNTRQAAGFWSPERSLLLAREKWYSRLCEEGRVIADALCVVS